MAVFRFIIMFGRFRQNNYLCVEKLNDYEIGKQHQ